MMNSRCNSNNVCSYKNEKKQILIDCRLSVFAFASKPTPKRSGRTGGRSRHILPFVPCTHTPGDPQLLAHGIFSPFIDHREPRTALPKDAVPMLIHNRGLDGLLPGAVAAQPAHLQSLLCVSPLLPRVMYRYVHIYLIYIFPKRPCQGCPVALSPSWQSSPPFPIRPSSPDHSGAYLSYPSY